MADNLKPYPSTRRRFVRNTGMALAGLPLLPFPNNFMNIANPGKQLPEIHIFSKHLQFLDGRDAAEVAASLGFAGIDLTVRPGGHVVPERVREELPKFLDAIRSGGSQCQLITTAVNDAHNAVDREVLETASAHGIRMYRTNWFRYEENKDLRTTLRQCRERIKEFSELNKALGIVGCYQNHAGTGVGASPWELDEIMGNANPASFGVQYDIRHATVEGGLSWENGLKLLRSKIKSIVLKDFKWGQQDGKWTVINTPIGQGMVDFNKYFALLKKYEIQVPAILHLEYPLGGAEHGHRKLAIEPSDVYDAMKKDLQKIRELWEKA